VDTSDYVCWYKFDFIACGIHPLDRNSSSALEDCEQGHFLFRLHFKAFPKSTPNNLIDRQVDQYCDKDNLSSLSAFQFSFDFVLSGSSLSLILSNLLRNRDKDNQVCNK
jgi:hypothetical protein